VELTYLDLRPLDLVDDFFDDLCEDFFDDL
jgi:hypothetical protein